MIEGCGSFLMTPVPHITVCVCTYRREDMLLRLLRSLVAQRTDGLFTISVVISDNDAAASARPTSEKFGQDTGFPITYRLEPRKSIALARNAAVAAAIGDFVAFVDDDEFADQNWLLNLFNACNKHNVAGVLGPVLPHFEEPPPNWVKSGKFHERPRHSTGFKLGWAECRTGNVLLRKNIIDQMTPPFSPAFPNGGEDQDFFRRAIQAGHTFVWCDEGIVFETVPPHRSTRSFMLRRALLRGQNTWKHKNGRIINLAKSFIALPLYVMALPFLQLRGHHFFVKYLVKACDHLGRVLACLGINPVRERQM